jgi:tetratricopeptide (TPR) repeat protein
MTTRDGVQDSWGGPAGQQPHDKAYFLNLLGDSQTGLGRHEAAIEAYRQAAEEFKSQGAHCSHALCLWKVAQSHLSLGEPWHALGYLEASLPLLHELGLTRHAALAREQLVQCRSELAGVRLLTAGERSETVSPENRDQGRFLLCPGPTDRRAG